MVWLGIAALLASLVTAGAGIYNTYQTNQQNIELNRENREWNREQVIDERNYNTPVNQMQRLADAGLNRNLAYGSVTPTSSGAATSVAPEVQPFDISSLQDVSNTLLQNRQLDIEHQRVDQEGKQVDSVVKYNDAVVVNLGTQNAVNDARRAVLQQQATNLGKEVEVMNSTMEVNSARIRSLDAATQEKNIQADILKFKQEHQEEEFNAQLSLLDAETKKYIADANLSNRELYEAQMLFALREAGYQMDVITKAAQAQNISLDSLNKIEQHTGLQLQNQRFAVSLNLDRIKLGDEMSNRGIKRINDDGSFDIYAPFTYAVGGLKFVKWLLSGSSFSSANWSPKGGSSGSLGF